MVICRCFKMQLLGVLKLSNTYILPPGLYMYSFHPFIRVFLNTCRKDIFIFLLLFCFKMRICCRFTARSQEILLNYVGTPQCGANGDNFT